ncbi:MAG: D-glycerate dehydrogenase [Rhodobacteraceae bacterium]|nr:D-glycerate dehydrogenase [Paracoccaceae bacterium]
MSGNRTKVVLTRRLPEPVETRLKELFDVTLRDHDTQMSHAELVDAVKTCDVLVPTITDKIDAGLLGQAGENLKLIANFGAGIDHIDVETARQRGILVSNTPDVVTEDTADMARASAFGMQIHYHNRRRLRPEIEDTLGATYWESLDQMVARMDILTINCPHTPSTFHLMNARRLRLLKPSAVIVNTSRGEVIDENALTRMLRANELAGAGLDVYEHGTDINPRLRELENVVLLPHMGSATLEGRIEMGEKVIINIKTYADGHRPPDMVVPSML